MKIEFLQKNLYNLPAGTPMVKCEPSTAVRQARSMVGAGSQPSATYKVYGGDDEVHVIPLFNCYLGEHHPQAKEVIGPFSLGEIRIDEDKLANTTLAKVTVSRNWPTADLVVVVNTAVSHGSIIYDEVFKNLSIIAEGHAAEIRRRVLRQVTHHVETR